MIGFLVALLSMRVTFLRLGFLSLFLRSSCNGYGANLLILFSTSPWRSVSCAFLVLLPFGVIGLFFLGGRFELLFSDFQYLAGREIRGRWILGRYGGSSVESCRFLTVSCFASL